jgi:anti-sigma B factor antagonist
VLTASPHLDIATRSYGSTVIVTLTGEFDVAVADELSHVIHRALEQRPKILILDLSAVTFVDCAGVRSVLAAQRHVEAHSAQLSIIPPPEHVHRVFVLAGVASSLPFLPVDGSQSTLHWT